MVRAGSAATIDGDVARETSEDAPLTPRGSRWLALGLVLLMVAPAVAAIASLAGCQWYPTDDFAVIDLRLRDVFTTHTPLTGLYSRRDWNHPGPLMFWGMAPLSWVSGQATWATRIGGALQGVALVWLGIATARHSTRLLLAAAVVTSFTYLAHHQWLFREPWNLHIPLLFFVLFLFLTHLAAIGRSRHVIGMSVAACVLVQTHVSYGLLVVAGFVYALGWIAYDAWRDRRAPESWRSTLVISAAVWVVAWIAPLGDVLVNWPGNLGTIIKYFLTGDHPSLGLERALRYMADEFHLVPPWLGGSERVQAFTGYVVPVSMLWLLVPVLLVAIAIVAVRVSRFREDARMLGLAVVTLVVGVVAIAGADEPRSYTFQWRAAIAAYLVVACVWCVARALAPRVGRAVRLAAVAVAIALAAWGSIDMTTAVVRGPSALLSAREPDLRQLMQAVDREPRPHGIVRVRAVGGRTTSLLDGVVNELDRRGVDVRVDPGWGRIFGQHRTVARSTPAVTWYVSQNGSATPALLARDGARLLASTSPLSPAEDRELAAIQQRIGAAVARAGSGRRVSLDSRFVSALAGIPGVSPADLGRLAELNARVEGSSACRCAIVAVPA